MSSGRASEKKYVFIDLCGEAVHDIAISSSAGWSKVIVPQCRSTGCAASLIWECKHGSGCSLACAGKPLPPLCRKPCLCGSGTLASVCAQLSTLLCVVPAGGSADCASANRPQRYRTCTVVRTVTPPLTLPKQLAQVTMQSISSSASHLLTHAQPCAQPGGWCGVPGVCKRPNPGRPHIAAACCAACALGQVLACPVSACY